MNAATLSPSPATAPFFGQLLVCAVGEMRVGFRLDSVLGVLREPKQRITAPNIDERQYLMRFRSQTLTAVDLPAFYGCRQPGNSRRMAVVARIASHPVCVVVDRIHGLHSASGTAPARLGSGPSLIDLAADDGSSVATLVLIDRHLLESLGVATMPAVPGASDA